MYCTYRCTCMYVHVHVHVGICAECAGSRCVYNVYGDLVLVYIHEHVWRCGTILTVNLGGSVSVHQHAWP